MASLPSSLIPSELPTTPVPPAPSASLCRLCARPATLSPYASPRAPSLWFESNDARRLPCPDSDGRRLLPRELLPTGAKPVPVVPAPSPPRSGSAEGGGSVVSALPALSAPSAGATLLFFPITNALRVSLSSSESGNGGNLDAGLRALGVGVCSTLSATDSLLIRRLHHQRLPIIDSVSRNGANASAQMPAERTAAVRPSQRQASLPREVATQDAEDVAGTEARPRASRLRLRRVRVKAPPTRERLRLRRRPKSALEAQRTNTNYNPRLPIPDIRGGGGQRDAGRLGRRIRGTPDGVPRCCHGLERSRRVKCSSCVRRSEEGARELVLLARVERVRGTATNARGRDTR